MRLNPSDREVMTELHPLQDPPDLMDQVLVAKTFDGNTRKDRKESRTVLVDSEDVVVIAVVEMVH